jgi:NADPH-dependent curcumin reductase CurA
MDHQSQSAAAAMTTATNRRLLLEARPKGLCAPGDLKLHESPLSPLDEGQALARVKYLSIDPTMRVWMGERATYLPAIPLGNVMRCFGLAEIVESRNPALAAGEKIVGLVGMQEYLLVNAADARGFNKIPHIPGVPDSAFLGVLGVTGITAYFGMTDVAKPQPGETLVVSAAAGATGSVAGQIGKIHGCRVVGIAGTDDKCQWLTGELGFDAAINYKHADWKAQLAAATPKGVDIDFENVGGEIMHATFGRMNLHGRVALCGLISGYTTDQPNLGDYATLIVKRLRVQGFLILDYAPRFAEAISQLAQWKMAGKLKDRETIVDGIANATSAINMLFSGANTGKLLVKLTKD